MLHRYPGKLLRELRKRALLSCEDVNRLTGISRMTLWRLERDKGRPQTTTLNKLLQIYGITINRLERLETIWANVAETGVVENDSAGKIQGVRPDSPQPLARPWVKR